MNYTTALVQLPLVKETTKEKVGMPEDVHRICADMSELAQECFQVLCLNAKNYLINRHLVTLGLVDASLVHPREVLRPAISDNAGAVVLVHNHPSGDPTPSAEDLRITKQMVEAGMIIDIKIVDHIIIGKKSEGCVGFLSLREDGVCDFA